MEFVLSVLVGYLLGSIPFGLIVGKGLAGVDIRKYGSGNIGATNMFRVLGPGYAIAVLLLDAAKGVAAVLIAGHLFGPGAFEVTAGLAVVAGHNWSLFLRFKGGRGVATGAGVLLALSPYTLMIALIIFVITVAATRFVSLGSILAAVSVTPSMIHFKEEIPVVLFGLVASLFVIFRHRPNIGRLLAGTEPKLGERVKRDS